MIFCVEDDKSIRDLMIYTLNTAGFEAAGFDNGTSLRKSLKREQPELILLDIMLPGEDGISILKALRSHPSTADIPVIMATAKGMEYDKITALDLGADDYLAKPFGMMEMVSRINAVLRRAKPKETPVLLRVGHLELNCKAHTVLVNGAYVELTRKEYDLLYIFMKNVGQVFSRDQLLEKIWDVHYIGETRTVDVHISSLRIKLGPCGGYIKTVRSVGYRMEDSM